MCAFKLFSGKSGSRKSEKVVKNVGESKAEPNHEVEFMYPCPRTYKYSVETLTPETRAKFELMKELVQSIPYGPGQSELLMCSLLLAIDKFGADVDVAILTPPWLGRRDWVIKYPSTGKLVNIADFTVPKNTLIVVWGVIAKKKPLADEILIGLDECADKLIPFDKYFYKNHGYARLPRMVFMAGDHVRIKAITYETGEDLTEEMGFAGMVIYNPDVLPEVYGGGSE